MDWISSCKKEHALVVNLVTASRLSNSMSFAIDIVCIAEACEYEDKDNEDGGRYGI